MPAIGTLQGHSKSFKCLAVDHQFGIQTDTHRQTDRQKDRITIPTQQVASNDAS